MIRRRQKYNAKRTIVDGIVFDSKREAKRYSELKIMERAKLIRDLKLQPRYPLLGFDGCPILIKSKGYPNGRRAVYVADFKYYDVSARQVVVEDVKGVDTPMSRLKRAIVEATYKIEIKLL